MNNLKKSGVYAITHKPSGNIYVGQALNIHNRWLQHKSLLRRNCHHAKHLQNTYNRDGRKSFSFRVLEFVQEEQLTEREQYWLDALKPIYNSCKVAASAIGLRHTDIAKQKISDALRRRVYTPEIRANMSKARRQSKKAMAALAKLHESKIGVPRKPETIEKLRLARKGFRHSPETIDLLRRLAAEINYKHPPDVREKISRGLKGRKLSTEHVEKMRIAFTGKKQSAETIAKRVEKLKGRPCSDYTKQRIAEANRARLIGTKQSPELIEKRAAALRGRPRPPEIMSIAHEALRIRNERRSAEIKSAILSELIKSPMATNVSIEKVTGYSVRTIRKYRKELQCQRPTPNDSASGEKNSPPKKAPLSILRSNAPQQLSLPLG